MLASFQSEEGLCFWSSSYTCILKKNATRVCYSLSVAT